jgi:sporulation protein YlmC with PRC-barrel domain
VDVVNRILDQPVVDRDGREMGRVDGILLEWRADAPPRLTSLLIGPSVLGSRLHPALGRWITWVEQRFGVSEGRPTQIPFSAIDRVRGTIMLAISVRDTAVNVVEERLRSWLLKLPGSR